MGAHSSSTCPGYGYAGVPAEVREHWEMLVGEYIANRESLAVVVVVMDARHPLTPLDLQLLVVAARCRAGRPTFCSPRPTSSRSRPARATLDQRARASWRDLVPQIHGHNSSRA